MVVSMGIFAIEDTLIKAASVTVPIGQILILFGLGGAFLFACLARLNKEPLFPPEVLSRPMRIRVVFEVIGRLFYFLSLSLIPLSAATVILQATPLVVVACAALLFGEQVGWRRWLAIVIGLIGVVIIVEPGTDSFSILSVLAVIGMLGFAGRDLASRAAPASLSTSILGLYGFLSVVVAGVLFSIWQGAPFVRPSADAALILLAAVLSGIAAYSCLMKAMRTGEVSAVTPFRYTRLLFGVALGVTVFGEELSFPMLLGSSLIVASGLFIVWRRRVTAPK
ncbi:putative transporter, RhaT family, DMT superfamily [Sulfitobacter donghicola DSW-25 = KCTC 12864 = JCM 14565]|uniref:Membrane protein n=2 Tax=Sulfitobacter TaxID=60136 RepID=A0A073IEC3_9RHOB|nr:membrane protein [Sulfitobacter donghicola DSW-25 = KCTC 12864 = JCM 14565]KIN60009.1 putative transporter, RhaT family, DMT superfamily [Sulfitobacter donghicola DSW-25 = KCTC 12864 = JCM 14565]